MKCKGLCGVITSLDYFEAEKHDAFRGKKGAFESTFKNILRLHENNVPVTINTMILPDNHRDIMDMIDFFVPKGIELHFDTIVSKGNAKENAKLLELSVDEEVKFIYQCIDYLEKKYHQKCNINDTSCGVGKEMLYLDKNGRFQLCPGLTEKENLDYFLGNTIETAYEKLPKFRLGCNHTSCKFYAECSFGCREKALFNYGSVNEPDVMLCNLLQKRELEKNG